jgi:ABC-type nitrate/sulfonate/bicarbonate transport system, permease component
MTEERKKYLRKLKTGRLLVRILQLGILVAFLGLWELVAYKKIVDPFLISSPSRMVKTFIELSKGGAIFRHLGATLWETVISFVLSTAIGTLIAVILWWSETFRRVSEPYLVILNALPKIRARAADHNLGGRGAAGDNSYGAPDLGHHHDYQYALGIYDRRQGKIQLLRSMNAKKSQILFKLVLPSNIPTLVSVLKINVGLSWVGTIMGEYMVSREGIGYLLVYGSQIFKLDLIMTSTVLLCLLATVMYLIVSLLEKLINKIY